MTRTCLVLLLACLPAAARAAAAEPAPEAGVVEIAAPAPTDPRWAQVEDARGTTRFAGALRDYLAVVPHGTLAARALVEQAALEDDLVKAAGILRQARQEGEGTENGSLAVLDLARLEYAQDHPEVALMVMDAADAWPRPDSLQPEWLYWRAQCRLLLKGFQRARDDFQHLVAVWPTHPRAEAALLGQADCDAALKSDDRAWAAYQKLAQGQGPFAAQAWWGMAGLRQREGRLDEARTLYQRLVDRYPASFEAHAAGPILKQLAKAPRPTPTPTVRPGRRSYWVQVGAFSRKVSATKLAARLKAHRYPTRIKKGKLDWSSVYQVKVGPYKTKAKAEAVAQQLETRENLPHRIAEE